MIHGLLHTRRIRPGIGKGVERRHPDTASGRQCCGRIRLFGLMDEAKFLVESPLPIPGRVQLYKVRFKKYSH